MNDQLTTLGFVRHSECCATYLGCDLPDWIIGGAKGILYEAEVLHTVCEFLADYLHQFLVSEATEGQCLAFFDLLE